MSGLGPTTVTGQQGQLLKIVQWVAAAWTDIQTKHVDWKFLWESATFPVTSGTDELDLSGNNIRRLDQVSTYLTATGVTDESFLEEIDYRDMRRTHKTGNQLTGRPKYFARRPDGVMLLTPTPDSAFTVDLEYYRKPQTLTANTDIPLLPEEYHLVIAYKALMKFASHYESTMQYADAEKEFNSIMSDMELTQLPQLKLPGSLA